MLILFGFLIVVGTSGIANLLLKKFEANRAACFFTGGVIGVLCMLINIYLLGGFNG
jgi:hypothetical protein